jgi:hypothetical protein
MYGTTMKSYNSSKYNRVDAQENNKSRKQKNKDNTPTTRYMKINERKYDRNNYETTSSCEVVKESFSKKEFPIASVIFTAIATMIALLLTTGILG